MLTIKKELSQKQVLEYTRELDKIIASELGVKHATMRTRYSASFDTRIKKSVERCVAYSTDLQLTITEYTWRACKALLARGTQHVNVFTLFTAGTFELVKRMGAGEELYGSRDALDTKITISVEDVTLQQKLTRGMADVRFVFEMHMTNSRAHPDLLDVLLAMRKELHPLLLFDYLPMRTIWKRCRSILDMPQDYGRTQTEYQTFLLSRIPKRLRGTEHGMWWIIDACNSKSGMAEELRAMNAFRK